MPREWVSLNLDVRPADDFHCEGQELCLRLIHLRVMSRIHKTAKIAFGHPVRTENTKYLAYPVSDSRDFLLAIVFLV